MVLSVELMATDITFFFGNMSDLNENSIIDPFQDGIIKDRKYRCFKVVFRYDSKNATYDDIQVVGKENVVWIGFSEFYFFK